jgi:hypothetical protein
MTLAEQIVRLSKLKASTGSVVSVYLNTVYRDDPTEVVAFSKIEAAGRPSFHEILANL